MLFSSRVLFLINKEFSSHMFEEIVCIMHCPYSIPYLIFNWQIYKSFVSFLFKHVFTSCFPFYAFSIAKANLMNVHIVARKENKENKCDVTVHLFTRSSRWVPTKLYPYTSTSVLLNSTALSLKYADVIVISYVALHSAEKLSFWDYLFPSSLVQTYANIFTNHLVHVRNNDLRKYKTVKIAMFLIQSLPC